MPDDRDNFYIDYYAHFAPGCVTGHNIVKYADRSISECKKLCSERSDCLAFEYGVQYGGSGGLYRPKDCNLQSGADRRGCNGQHHNLDLYVKRGKIEYC